MRYPIPGKLVKPTVEKKTEQPAPAAVSIPRQGRRNGGLITGKFSVDVAKNFLDFFVHCVFSPFRYKNV